MKSSGLNLYAATERHAFAHGLDRAAIVQTFFAEQHFGPVSAEACLWRGIRYALGKEMARMENVMKGARA